MAQLLVRNLDEKLVHELEVRAVGHGRSAEAEHREILREALMPPRQRESIKDVLLAIPDVGEDADFER